MTAVQNIGAADYQMPITQQEQLPIPEDFSNEPAVYDPALEEKKESAGSMKGLTIGGIIGAAGIGLAVWKGRDASKYKKMAEALKQENVALKEQLDGKFKTKMKKFWANIKNKFSKKSEQAK